MVKISKRGAIGAAGPQGPQGTAGLNGATIRSGSGSPAGGLGAVGDYYLNTANGDFHEKTGASTWTLRVNLTGPAGTNGTNGTNGLNGATIRSGSGAPAGGLGAVGDYYLNTANGNFHEKTGASTWTLRVNLTGPQGPVGSVGATGPAGSRIYVDSGVPSNSGGANGDIYIDDTNGDLYEKDAGVWYYEGNIRGPQGVQGPVGAVGATGPAGTNGATIRSGSGAPAGGLGVVGDYYINTANGDFYEKTGTSTWTLRVNLTGPAGTNGTNGTNGQGVPTGGSTNQFLRKTSATDFATGWSWLARLLQGGQGAPSITKGNGAGTTGTATLDADSTDFCGAITVTVSGTASTNTTIATVTFSTSFTAKPFVLVIGYNQTAANQYGARWFVDVANVTTSSFSITSAATNITGTQRYIYLVIGS